MRDAAPASQQQDLAPQEHEAFAREYATESPLLATGLIAAIPGYQVAKAAGIMGSRTGSSQPMAQMMAGYSGLGQGWMNAARRGFGALFPQTPAPAGTGYGAVPQDNLNQ